MNAWGYLGAGLMLQRRANSKKNVRGMKGQCLQAFFLVLGLGGGGGGGGTNDLAKAWTNVHSQGFKGLKGLQCLEGLWFIGFAGV